MSYKSPQPCKHCGQWISEELIAKRKALKGERVRKALKEAVRKGIKIGRPRTVDYEAIRKLRAKGVSVRKIAAIVKVSTWTVRNTGEDNP